MLAGADKSITVSKAEPPKDNVPSPDNTPPVEPPTQLENTNPTGADNFGSTAELLKQIESLKKENDTLKQFNKELVTHTPAPNQPTVEECILNLCAPDFRKERLNG